ncbi:MAG TPA: acyltransferase family protein, partial [Anaerovoracaceae bacterium]|nr:acyltransferase family protein [Anaerovoracaceae bacterium]
PLGHLWSLAIEEQFYLFWPLILGLGFRIFKKRKWIIGGTIAIIVISTLAMAVIYTPGDDPSRVYYGTDTRAYALLLGALAAMIWPGGKMSADISRSKKLSVDLAGAGSLIFILWMLVSTNQYQVFLYRGGLFIFSLVATLFVVVLAHPAGIFGRIFSVEPLRLLGKWSYGIYLWHYPVIILSTPYIDTDGPNVLRSLWQIAVSIALAALSFYLIEEPIRFKRIKLAKIFSRATACILIIFMVLIVTSTEGLQILAKDRVTDTYEQIGSVEDEIEIEPGKDEIEAESGKDEIEAEPGKNEIEAESEKNEIEAESGKDNVKNVIDSGEGITIISDSLLIDAKPIIEDRLPGIIINTKKGRQMYDAPEVVDELRSTGRLGDTVIIGLGSNGAFTEKQLKATIDCLEGAGEIILINTRVPKPWETVVNDILAQVVEFYPEVTLIDWYDVSKGHNEYFYKDGVHLNNVGIEAYIEMLLNAL